MAPRVARRMRSGRSQKGRRVAVMETSETGPKVGEQRARPTIEASHSNANAAYRLAGFDRLFGPRKNRCQVMQAGAGPQRGRQHREFALSGAGGTHVLFRRL